MRLLTVKLSGRTQAPDQSRGRTMSSRAHGDTTELHGPLQRLLDAIVCHSDAFDQFFKSGGWFPQRPLSHLRPTQVALDECPYLD